MMKEIYRVEGMTCAACQNHVEKAVGKLPDVEKVSVNLLQNTMAVIYDEKKVNPSGICQAVRAAGYRAYLPGKNKAEAPAEHA